MQKISSSWYIGSLCYIVTLYLKNGRGLRTFQRGVSLRRLSVPHDGGNLSKRYGGTPLRAILALRDCIYPSGIRSAATQQVPPTLSDKPQHVQGVGTVLPSHLTTEPSHSARSSPFTQTHQVAAYDGPSYPQLAGHRWSTSAAIRHASRVGLTVRPCPPTA